MPVISVENTGMSVSEEGLAINGSTLGAGQLTTAPLDEPRVFVFVEKKPNEGLGLYLVPFEEEPLTGLFVKTIVPGKPAARLAVFDPGDKIVSVNGKSLKGLSYRESTDFIRHCPGPNVKMGIIKHALHTKADLDKLQTMAIYQRQSGAEFLANAPNVDAGGAVDVDVHPPVGRLSGSVPSKSYNIGGAIEEPMIMQKSDAGVNLESEPGSFGGAVEIDAPDFGFGSGASAGFDTNANMEGASTLPDIGVEGKGIDINSGGAFEGISAPSTEVNYPAPISSDDKFDVDVVRKSDAADLHAPAGGLDIGGDVNVGLPGIGFSSSRGDNSGSDTSDGEGGRIKRKLKIPGFGFSSDAKGYKPDNDDSDSDTSDGHGGRIKRKVKKARLGAGGKFGLSKDADSDSDTSDGQGGRIRRKLKKPKMGMDIDVGLSGGVSKADSGSETSDGKGGRIKRKLKVPAVEVSTSEDDHHHKKKKFKLPKFGFRGRSKSKSDREKGDTLDTSGAVEVPSVKLEGDVQRPEFDTRVKASADGSGSDTSDGQGGRIKRKLKLPGFQVGGGISGDGKGDSGSDTSDGHGGRMKRKLKAPKVGGDASVDLNKPTIRHDSDSDHSDVDSQGCRIKRKPRAPSAEVGVSDEDQKKKGKLKMPKFHMGGRKKAKKDKASDSGSETSDGEGGRVKRKFKAPKFGVDVDGGASGNIKGKSEDDSGSDTSDGHGGRIKRKFKLKGPSVGIAVGKGEGSGSDTSDGQGGRIKRKLKSPDMDVDANIKGHKSRDDSSDGQTKRKFSFKLPKFGGKKKSKDKKHGDSSEDERSKKTFDVPSVELQGGVPKADVDVKLKKERPILDGSGSDTSDGEGGRIKRKLKLQKPGFGIGGGANIDVKKGDDDSGSETSDGEGGRIKRKLKLSLPKFGFGGGVSGKGKGDDSDSGSDTSDGRGGRMKRKLKLKGPDVGFSGGVSGKAKDSDSDTSDGEGGRIKRKLKMPAASADASAPNVDLDTSAGLHPDDHPHHKKKFGIKLPKFGFGSRKSRDITKPDQHGDSDSSEDEKSPRKFEIPSDDIETGVTPIKVKLKDDGSGSDTSDGEGGRIKRKLKGPKFGIGLGGDASGRVEAPKVDDSGSDTSDGEGGRIKRKHKGPKLGFGISAGISGDGDKPKDDSGSDTSDGEGGRIKRKLKTPAVNVEGGVDGDKGKESDDDEHKFRLPKFKMPKIKFGSGKKTKKGKREDHPDDNVEVPSLNIEGTSPDAKIEADLKHQRHSGDDSGSDTSDGEGGRIKRKLKMPKFGIGFGGGASGEVEKPKVDDSGSDTSDGEGGRIKRKLKGPKFGIGFGGGASGDVQKPKVDDSGSDTSDGEGGRIKRKLKMPKFGIGFGGGTSGEVEKPKADGDNRGTDFGFGISGGLSVEQPKVDAGSIEIESKTLSNDVFAKETAPARQVPEDLDSIFASFPDFPSGNNNIEADVVLPSKQEFEESAPDMDIGGGEFTLAGPEGDLKDVSGGVEIESKPLAVDVFSKDSVAEVHSIPEAELDALFTANGESDTATSDTGRRYSGTARLRTTSTDIDDSALDTSIKSMDANEIKDLIVQSQRRGRASLGSDEKTTTTHTTVVKQSGTGDFTSKMPSYSTGSRTMTVTTTKITKTGDAEEPTVETSTTTTTEELDPTLKEMDPNDIKKLIFSTSRTGRVSLPPSGGASQRRSGEFPSRDKVDDGLRRPTSMHTTSSSPDSKTPWASAAGLSAWRSNPDVTIVEGDDSSATTKADSRQQTEVRTYRSIYSRPDDSEVGLKSLKSISPDVKPFGSFTMQSSTTTSRITTTSHTEVRKVPGLSRTFPELLDEEIRQVKQTAEAERSAGPVEDRRRWSMEKRAEWMRSSPTKQGPSSPTDSSEQSRLTSRDRRRQNILGEDEKETEK